MSIGSRPYRGGARLHANDKGAEMQQRTADAEELNTELCTAGGFSILAGLLATPLEDEEVASLADGNQLAHLEEYASYLGLDVSDAITAMRDVLGGEEAARRLNVESTSLFNVRTPAPPAMPYESVWREPEKLAMGKSAQQVARAYFHAEVRPSEEYGDAAPDHIARELSFVAVASREIVLALERDDLETADHWVRIRNGFLVDHVSKWAPEFFEAIVEDDSSDFFSAVAEIGTTFVSAAVERAE